MVEDFVGILNQFLWDYEGYPLVFSEKLEEIPNIYLKKDIFSSHKLKK